MGKRKESNIAAFEIMKIIKMQLFWISNVMLNPTSGQLLLYLKMIYETVLNQSSSMFLSRGLWLDWLLLGHLVETGHV